MPKKESVEIIWLKERISRIAYGEKTDVGIRPNISKKLLIKNNKLLIRRLPNKKILEHVENKNTVYYYGNGKTNSEETLVMIDVDVQKKNNLGSTQGALDFINHLKTKFPKLYYESSTNGKGIHAYFILKKPNISARTVNKTLKNFENWLKKEAEETKADIEIVEIKGLCPEILYKENKITNIKYGTLAKIPRNLNVLSSMDNQFLSIKDIEKEYSVEIKIKNKKEGSISNKLFSEEDIKKLDKYKEIFKDLTDNHKLKARNHVVTEDDFAIALLILLFINKNPNKDGSIPTERVKQLWISLFKFNNVKRNWNHHRWKVIRDLLSMKNLIDWTDNKYEFGNKLNNQKGVACKWSLSNKLLRKVNNLVSDAHDAQKTERASLMDTNITIIDKTKEDNRYLTPILRFLRTINYEDMLTRMFSRMETLCTV
jgi:hypothetical protein